jgi:ribose 5-phosphate isomerase RpiB
LKDGRADRGVLVCSSGVGAAIAACKLGARFDGGERYVRRLRQVEELERMAS